MVEGEDCAVDFVAWDVAIGGGGISNSMKNLLTFSRSIAFVLIVIGKSSHAITCIAVNKSFERKFHSGKREVRF